MNAMPPQVDPPNESYKTTFARWIRVLVAVLGGVLGLVLIAWLLLPNTDALLGVQATLSSYALILMMVRLSVFAVIWWFWNELCEWVYRDRSAEAMQYMKGRRHFFLALFVAIELLLIQNVVGRFWGWVG